MTSISSTMPSFPTPPSPRARIDAKIAAATSAGTISQTDETALETAVDAIGQSLRSGGASAANTGSTSATANGSGTSFKDKLDGLIDAQVTSGTLTDAQATELKGIFSQGASVQGQQGQDADGDADQVAATTGTTGAAPAAGGAVHGHHHHGGGGGGMAAIMAALDGSDPTDSSTDTSAIDALTGTTATGTTAASTTASATTSTTASTTAVSSADSATQQLDKLIGFLEKMRESIGSVQTYGSASASSSGTDAAGMVFSGIA